MMSQHSGYPSSLYQWCHDSQAWAVSTDGMFPTYRQELTTVLSTWHSGTSQQWVNAHCRRVTASANWLTRSGYWSTRLNQYPLPQAALLTENIMPVMASAPDGYNRCRFAVTKTGQLFLELSSVALDSFNCHGGIIPPPDYFPRLKHNARLNWAMETATGKHPVWANDATGLLESPIATLGCFFVENNKLALRLPLKNTVLPSITRRQWLLAAKAAGINVQQTPLFVKQVDDGDGGMLLGNSLRGSFWLKTINNRILHVGSIQAHPQFAQWTAALTCITGMDYSDLLTRR
jgi:hypothetical protein